MERERPRYPPQSYCKYRLNQISNLWRREQHAGLAGRGRGTPEEPGAEEEGTAQVARRQDNCPCPYPGHTAGGPIKSKPPKVPRAGTCTVHIPQTARARQGQGCQSRTKANGRLRTNSNIRKRSSKRVRPWNWCAGAVVQGGKPTVTVGTYLRYLTSSVIGGTYRSLLQPSLHQFVAFRSTHHHCA
jgi:hypothetical protein